MPPGYPHDRSADAKAENAVTSLWIRISGFTNYNANSWENFQRLGHVFLYSWPMAKRRSPPSLYNADG
jgi:hypothetical protein